MVLKDLIHRKRTSPFSWSKHMSHALYVAYGLSTTNSITIKHYEEIKKCQN
ncbi:MAG: hypothetical protein GF311_21460 [Candidatus Lokiarchaeota archaeon]|nr:hypothetical protein [Candidatus Lokiarchaeota archaeon]